MNTKLLTVNKTMGYRVPMTGYTKLFGSIIASTIWRESKETKIVWITMLAMANQDGIVEASVPGLADFARVSTDECRAALNSLMSPDPDSRTKEHEGRRIAEVDGGWQILNHAKYRQKMRSIERREYLTQKQREYRGPSASQPPSTTVNHRQPIAEAEAEAKARGNPPVKLSAKERISLEREADKLEKERDRINTENLSDADRQRRREIKQRLIAIERAIHIPL